MSLVYSAVALLPGASIVLLAGCTLVAPDSVDRNPTLPGALDLQVVEVGAVLHDRSLPDSVNVEVVVTDLSACPKDARCQLPDGIYVRSIKHPNGRSIRIAVEHPYQFFLRRAYTLSLYRSGPYDVGGEVRYVPHVVGFDPYFEG